MISFMASFYRKTIKISANILFTGYYFRILFPTFERFSFFLLSLEDITDSRAFSVFRVNEMKFISLGFILSCDT